MRNSRDAWIVGNDDRLQVRIAVFHPAGVHSEQHPHYTEVASVDEQPLIRRNVRRTHRSTESHPGGNRRGLALYDQGLVTAEVFADYMEMAEYLLESGYKDPAAVIAGSTLEEHLRQLCRKNGIPIVRQKDGKDVPLKADQLNSNLTKAEVYSTLDQKQVTAWLDLRNKAAHGEYGEYNADQVKGMITGITEFMARVAV